MIEDIHIYNCNNLLKDDSADAQDKWHGDGYVACKAERVQFASTFWRMYVKNVPVPTQNIGAALDIMLKIIWTQVNLLL